MELMHGQATFSGGVEAAILAFMRDLLDDEAFDAKLWRDDAKNQGSRLYTTYSLGLMLGLLAIALNITVAAVAAVNAAIACHFSLFTEDSHKRTMKYRVVFCMILQFISGAVSGMSFILLTLNYDWSFAVVAGFLFFAGSVVAAYHLIALFGTQWLMRLWAQPLHILSLLLCSLAFSFDVSTPSRSSWFTITTFGVTIVYHTVAVLYNTSPYHQHPSIAEICCVFVISMFWASCSVTTRILGRWFEGEWGLANMYVVCILSALEAAVLFAIGVINSVLLDRWIERNRPETVAWGVSAMMRVVHFFKKLRRNIKAMFT
ncbi:hypothetical protein EST38_g6492 [Candolleomyces aberdarensis]|uniref:Uncharacterized protein n=1 Tax=Candolleomyces aberdarensis TaxID=2316362 RepID=A0A4Q2DHY2_9AGAR|nr:hypothetical protein EST38_g6492 [Candolleomyces aberdarensis]